MTYDSTSCPVSNKHQDGGGVSAAAGLVDTVWESKVVMLQR